MISKLTVLFLAVVAWTGMGSASTQEATASDTLVWCGLDYSMVKMIGTKDFRKPDEIFPAYLEKWNGLFVKEMLPKVEKLTASVRTDTSVVQPGNAKANPGCIIRQDGTYDEVVKPSHITEQDIADIVKGYDLKYNQGLGLVFVMDRLVKDLGEDRLYEGRGCLYVVFFDIGSRKVVYSERLCEEALGNGFRNYWFSPVKQAVGKLPRLYQKARAVK